MGFTIKRPAFLVLVIVFLTAAAPDGKIYNCTGVWTNKDCEDEPQAVLPELPVREVAPEDERRKRLEISLRDLRQRAVHARQEYNLAIPVEDVINACSSSDDLTCESLIFQRAAYIDERIFAERALRAREDTSISSEEAVTNITMIDNRTYFILPERRREPQEPIVKRPPEQSRRPGVFEKRQQARFDAFSRRQQSRGAGQPF